MCVCVCAVTVQSQSLSVSQLLLLLPTVEEKEEKEGEERIDPENKGGMREEGGRAHRDGEGREERRDIINFIKHKSSQNKTNINLLQRGNLMLTYKLKIHN